MKPVIVPTGIPGQGWTKDLTSALKPGDISKRLGFKSNCEDDPEKVKYSWGFTVNGKPCGIWDYKGARWSVYDPHDVLHLVFPEIDQ